MANKKKAPSITKRVWNPTCYEVNIGDGEYVIEPQPIERIIEFDEVVQLVTDKLQNVGGFGYWVVEDTEDGETVSVSGPYDDEALAKEYVEAGQRVKVETPSYKQIAETLVNAPFPVLRVLIPDLKEEHVRQSSLPNLKFVMDLIIEVNGVEWFEQFLKNSIGPLLPEIVNLVVGAAKTSLQGSMTPTIPPGETPLILS